MRGVFIALGQPAEEDDDDGDADDDGTFVTWSRCYACGHRLAYRSTSCPQCEVSFDDRPAPESLPELCECRRCRAARSEASS